MTAEVEALLERLDEAHGFGQKLAGDAAALIRAQAEEIAKLREQLAAVAQAERERDLLGTAIGTGYAPPENLIKDEMTRRRAARAVELHEEIARLREQIAAAAKQEPVAWLGVGCISKKPIVQLPDEPRMPACDPWRPLYAAPVPAGDAVSAHEKQLVAWHYYREPYFYVILDQEVAPNDPIRSNGCPLYAIAPREAKKPNLEKGGDCHRPEKSATKGTNVVTGAAYPNNADKEPERAQVVHGSAQADAAKPRGPNEATLDAAPAPDSDPAIRVPWKNPAPIPTERTPLDTAIKIAELERECERLRAEQREEYAKTRAAIETWRGRCNELQVVADAAKAFVAWWTDGQDDFDDLHKHAEVIVVAVRALDRGEVK
jgi:hypothetical protein